MARPKADLPSAGAIEALANAEGVLALKVTPGARLEGLALGERQLLVKVRAKPQDGKANDAVLALLARALGRPPSRLRLLRGASGRAKLVQLLP